MAPRVFQQQVVYIERANLQNYLKYFDAEALKQTRPRARASNQLADIERGASMPSGMNVTIFPKRLSRATIQVG